MAVCLSVRVFGLVFFCMATTRDIKIEDTREMKRVDTRKTCVNLVSVGMASYLLAVLCGKREEKLV